MVNPAFPWTPQPKLEAIDASQINPDYDAKGLMQVSAHINQGAYFLKKLEAEGHIYSPWYLDRLGHWERFLYETASLINKTRVRHGAVANQWPFAVRKPKAAKAPRAGAPLKKRKVKSGITPKLRFSVLQEADFRCAYCGRSADDIALEVDHVHPASRGGITSKDNLVAACWECNIGKGARTGVEVSS